MIFITFDKLPKNECENYIEFQVPNAEKNFFDEKSLYISKENFINSGFYSIWTDCLRKYDFFDMDTINDDDLSIMLQEASMIKGTAEIAVREFAAWAIPFFETGALYIGVVFPQPFSETSL